MTRKTWLCEISGDVSADLMPGADFPMRQAVCEAFHEVTGSHSDVLASGWNWTLDEERAEAFDKGWSKGKAWGAQQERARLLAIIRENEEEWDTVYSAEHGINYDEIVKLLTDA